MKFEDFGNKIVLKKGDQEVGHINVEKHTEDMASFDLNIKPEHQRKGFGTEAVKGLLGLFKKNGMKEVSTFVDDDNPNKEGSYKVARRAGMGFAGKQNGGTNFYKNLNNLEE